MEKITVYADGGCSGNPGPGAWACLIFLQGERLDLCGSESMTTNNRMELAAVINALEKIKTRPTSGIAIDIFTDSQYVKKGITEWIHKWIRNGWRNTAKDPVKNRDLWQTLLDLSQAFSIQWHWIKGHGDNEYNNECDRLVRLEIAKRQRG